MNSGPPIVAALLAVGLASAESDRLWVDFNSTNQDAGPRPEAGYQSYDAAHEVASGFVPPRDYPAFGTTVSLRVAFPNTTDNRVRQMIGRGNATWLGNNFDLLRDWIGVDARKNSGGNGAWDGTTGTPTYITIALTGLPAANYSMVTYHHDLENMNSFFTLEVSTDGGGTWGAAINARMTNSLAGGTPAENEVLQGTAPNVAGGDPADLPSTLDFGFTADGTSDVVLRFAPLPPDSGATTHQAFFGLNGFEIDRLSSPDAPTDLTLSADVLSLTAEVGTVVGTLATTDPTPGDTFLYELVDGPGSDHNAEFTIVGDALVTERELSGRPAGSTLSVRIRTTDAGGESLVRVFPIRLVNDSDGDGLDDDWERTHFPDLGQDAGGDPDGDTLDNLAEQAAGTDPTRADTDDDGLGDAQENASGVFNGPADPGSSPLLADTDGDGLDDGVEVSTANGHVTNPNLADSDGDHFSDPVEIARGTDPNDAADFPNTLLPLVISEIMARNVTGIEDGFGTRSDWIEIRNPNSVPVNLDGYFLTDDPLVPTRWNFPDVTIQAGGLLVVFASGLDTVDPLGRPHTNFQLDAAGEYLAIVRPGGTAVDDAFHPAFPAQFADISYGRDSGGATGFFQVPTPGATNGATFPGVVRDTNFDHDRGFYTDPFAVAITSATPGATIRYTTDGSRPSETTGTVYAGPVPIATTTTLRAIAYLPGWIPTNVDTQTYVFVDQVARQPADPPGWPSDWGYSSDAGQVVPADYAMDPRVVDNTVPGYSVPEALLAIPTVSIAMEPAAFISTATGIYANPQSRWERPCSIEYIRPDGVPGFQYDAKIEVHGNASRRPYRMQKHSLRVTFTSQFGGPPKLHYPLFPESPVDTFNKLVLRACFTDSWGLVSWANSRYRPNDSQYFRDVWMKQSLRDMGQPSSYGNFVHLYVNGLYFGLHNLTERLEDDFFAEHLGGAPEHWEVNEDFSGPDARWNQMMAIDPSTPDGYAAISDYVDLGNFADYMLLHLYADAEDWPHHNGYAAANPVSGDGRFRFFAWDQEIVLDYHGRAAQRIGVNQGGGALFQKLRANQEFRLFFADRAQHHCFNDGALSLGASQARYLAIAGLIDQAIVAESARWGDVQASTPYGNQVEQPSPLTDYDHLHYPPALNYPDQAAIYFTREDNWLVERDNVVDHYLPAVHDTGNSYALINVLRAAGLFPSLDAPVFGLHGGTVPSGYQLPVSATSDTIYYTLDGSDPRLPGGAVNPAAGSITRPETGEALITLAESGTVMARVFDGGEWSALTAADFLVGNTADAANLVVSEIMYNPVGTAEDTEFIELMNISPDGPVDLGGVSFTAGISYTFPAGIVIPPMGRVVVVASQAAFYAAYPASGAALAPGEFTGSLSNSGETITLLAHDGGTIRSFAYDDLFPWPESPDGLGDSLVLVAPATNPDHSLPDNWRPSTAPAGNPGAGDATEFTGDPDADLDGDGDSALLEYAAGTSDSDPAQRARFDLGTLPVDEGGTPVDYLTISHRRNLAADDVRFEAQLSTNLADWSALDVVRVSEIANGDGTSTVTYRSLFPFASRTREFLRLRVAGR